MTDKQFTTLLVRVANAYNRYKPLLDIAEAEYERRYGQNPSDCDDDGWIDSLHGAGGLARAQTAAEVHESAMMRNPPKHPDHLPE